MPEYLETEFFLGVREQLTKAKTEIEDAWKYNQYLADENERLRIELAKEHRYIDIVKKTTEDVPEQAMVEVCKEAMRIVKACGYRVVYGE